MAEIRYYVSSGLRPHLYLRVADPRKPLVCAPRTAQKHICGVLRPCTLGDFSLYGQRKVTKRNPPRSRRPFPLRFRLRGKVQGALPCAPVRAATGSAHPALLAKIGARPNSPGAKQRATGSNTRLAVPDFGCDARRRLRGFEQPTSDRYAKVFSTPRMAHPGTARLWACAPKG